MPDNTNNSTKKSGCVVIHDRSEEARIREAARIREKALHDEASALKNAWIEGFIEGFKEGFEKGYKEGRAKERDEIIDRMRSAGFTDEQIKAILGS